MRPRYGAAKTLERQQLVIAFLLVVLLAISLLYCVGLGTALLWQASESMTTNHTPEANGFDLQLVPLLGTSSPSSVSGAEQ